MFLPIESLHLSNAKPYRNHSSIDIYMYLSDTLTDACSQGKPEKDGDCDFKVVRTAERIGKRSDLHLALFLHALSSPLAFNIKTKHEALRRLSACFRD